MKQLYLYDDKTKQCTHFFIARLEISIYTSSSSCFFFITIFTECQAHTGSTCRSGCSELVWGAIAFLKPLR